MHQSNQLHQLGRRDLLAALLLGACAAPAAAAQLQLPPIIAPPTQQHLLGKVIFQELVTPDLTRARQFYGGLFGWTFRDLDVGETAYAEAILGDRSVGGMFQKKLSAGEHRQPAWLTYISARNTDATVQTALQHGAKLLFAPHTFPDRGREAVLTDPQGAVFAVLASSSGDPPDLLAGPGEWIWSSLITRDPDTAPAFYQALFDYEVFPAPVEAGAEHLVLASESYARASVNPPPAARPDLYPHWLNYVRVDDAAAMAARAVALGGRILVAPRPTPRGGTIALVADPLGAPFGLLVWSNTGTTAGIQ
jgi:predicted enzyme related to lactoylglutathione lyase